MSRLLLIAVAGLLAQFVDGSLGMAYGVTSTTVLLAAGFAPAAASASVHLAELGTTLVAGVAHHRFGNVDWALVRRLALPGAAGAFLGAVVLSNLSAEAAEPWMAIFLAILGVYILVRFARPAPRSVSVRLPAGGLPRPVTGGLGLVAGFLDAAGGGGWGPIGTPTLLASGRIEARKVVGSIDTSEFLVTLGASAGFLLALGTRGVSVPTVLALLAGGMVAAPAAAWVVRKLPPRLLGTGIGLVVLLTNGLTLRESFGVQAPALLALAAVVVLVWGGAWLVARRQSRNATTETASAGAGGER